VLASIPKSAKLDDGRVLVAWGLDEARVLKNIGVKGVPSPIEGRYKWPGLYKPFNHQRTTAAFMTLNKRAFCFNDPGCVDADTEYLSPTGWVKISDYQGGKVAQYKLDGSIEFVEPTAYIKKPCGEMIHFKTKYGVDQLLSPEHRMIVHSSANYEKATVMEAADVFQRHEEFHAGIHRPNPRKAGSNIVGFSHAAIPSGFYWTGGSGLSLTEAQLRLQIAVIADGHFGSNTNRCVVRVKRQRKIERLRQLLLAASVAYVERVDTSKTGAGFHVFSFDAPLRLKKFDSRFWGAGQNDLAIIRDEVFHWDGSNRGENKGSQFFSTEKESADFVQFAFASVGIVARITEDVRQDRTTCYVVTVRKTDNRYLVIKSEHNRTAEIRPSTDGFKYCFSVPSTFLLFRRNGCIFASGNTGKTAAFAWATDYLMNKGYVKRALIICPLSIMSSAWQADLFKVLMHRRVDVAYGDRRKRAKVIQSDAEFVVINFDGVETVLEDLKAGGFNLIIIDEANAVKTATTKRWKAINELITPDTWLWMATGTPASQAPTDAYGLAKMLNPESVPRNFYSFRDMVMWKVTQFKWKQKSNAAEIVNRVLQPAIRFTKEECLDLPELLYTTREVALTPQQIKYYKLLKDQFIMSAGTETVTSVNAATNLNKLLQVSGGAVYSDDGNTVEFDITNRYNVLLEAIEESTHKVLVFVPYRHTITVLEERLKKDKITVEVIDGSVPVGQRTRIFQAFQTEPDPRVLLIQPAAASHGVTLHAANTVVWWGPVTSNETYHQANARVHRAGQKNPCLVVRLCGSDVERKLYDSLDGKTEDMESLLNLYREEVLDTAKVHP
jgi:superfamily II DNA or RNA helicase